MGGTIGQQTTSNSNYVQVVGVKNPQSCSNSCVRLTRGLRKLPSLDVAGSPVVEQNECVDKASKQKQAFGLQTDRQQHGRVRAWRTRSAGAARTAALVVNRRRCGDKTPSCDSLASRFSIWKDRTYAGAALTKPSVPRLTQVLLQQGKILTATSPVALRNLILHFSFQDANVLLEFSSHCGSSNLKVILFAVAKVY